MDPSQLLKENEDAFREEICHILYHEKFVFCLLCKRDIGESSAVFLHLIGSGHRENKNKLFSNYTLDPFCDSTDLRFAEIVNNSKPNTAKLLSDCNRQCYVYQMDAKLICFICNESFSSACATDQIKNDLISHLGEENESHSRNCREMISWVYHLNNSNAFILFHKLLVYCSACDKILDYDDNLMLYAAVGHLQTLHHKTNLKQAASIESPIEYTSQTGEISDYDNLLSACGGTGGDRYQLNKDKTVTCTVCGETVEIFNENPYFSIQLHSQKHKELSLTSASTGLEYKDNIEYVCPVCLDTISVFNKDVEFSIARHFEDKKHDVGFDTVNINKGPDPSKMSLTFSKEMEAHKMYFVTDENDLICKLCNCIIRDASNDTNSTIQAINNHILQPFHSDQHKITSKQLTNAVVSYNNEIRTKSPSDYDALFNKLVKKNSILSKNKYFIEKKELCYFCTLCQIKIPYSPKENSQLLNLLFHFNGGRHAKCFQSMHGN